MSSSKIALSAATLITLGSLAAAVYEYRQAHGATLALAEAARIRPAPRQKEAAPPPPAPVRQAGTQAVTAGSEPAPGGPPRAQPSSGVGALMELLGNPAMQKQNEVMARVRLDGQYGALFRTLNLPADQVDKFKNLLVEKAMVGFDSMSVAHQQGIDAATDPQGFFQAVAGAEKTVDTEISTLLGSDAYAQFQDYQQTIPARNTSLLLTQALSYTATPLTDTEAASVIQILTQEGTPPLPPGNPFAVLNGDLGIIKLNDQGLGQLQGILSAPQLQALQEKIQQQQQLLAARQRMGR
jgi:hypothetical protein